MRTRTRILAVMLSCSAIDASVTLSQGLASAPQKQARTQAIVASFNKSKHVVKEKYGVRLEKYKEVRSEPAIRANSASYSGTYEVADLGFILHLRVDASGRVDGSGEEPLAGDARVARSFTLRNAKVDGALLTGTKLYSSGDTAPFEGVFINRTSFDSPTDRGMTTFGLGVVGTPVRVSGLTLDKFFYELKR